jgi:hypothetical protein
MAVTDIDQSASEPQDDNEQLLGAYRSAATEEAPPHLDDSVLKKAAVEVRKDRSVEWFLPWRRPAAFVAAVGLSLAILIEIDESELFNQNLPVPIIDTGQSTSDLGFSPIPDEPGSAAQLPRSDVAPPSGLASSNTLQEFSTEATRSSTRMREIGQTAEHRSLGSDASYSQYADQEGHNCSDEVMATPDSWLQCIEELTSKGFVQEANSELARLLLAFPETTLLITR